MSIDAALYLESLFGDPPAAATLHRGRTETDTEGELLSPFLWFIRRPDCHGRIGWESPDVPEWQRWWARFDFDELPELPEGLSIPLDDAGPPRLPR